MPEPGGVGGTLGGNGDTGAGDTEGTSVRGGGGRNRKRKLKFPFASSPSKKVASKTTTVPQTLAERVAAARKTDPTTEAKLNEEKVRRSLILASLLGDESSTLGGNSRPGSGRRSRFLLGA